jgi:hypothetical protein
MAFDPFSSGGGSNYGSHVVFAPTPIGPEWNPDPNTWQPVAPPPAAPGVDTTAPPKPPVPAPDAPDVAQPAAATNIAQAFAQALALQSLTEMMSSSTATIANKLPGAPGNVYGMMQELRDAEKLADSRRELSQKMAKKDDDMNYRS